MPIPDTFTRLLISQATDCLAESLSGSAQYAEMAPGVESPLEAMFDMARYALQVLEGNCVEFARQVPVVLRGKQFRIDRAYAEGLVKVAVELDGHGFHEKTREQVAQRNTRDSELARDGWFVLHLSWDQVYGDPLGCARKAEQAVVDAWALSQRGVEHARR